MCSSDLMNGDHPPLPTHPADARDELGANGQEQLPVVTSAEVGIGVGGVFGVLIGTGVIVVPGIGPLIAAGTFATIAAGAAAGGVVGGAIGLLTGHGISNADAHLYAEGVKRGGTLVTVVADDGQRHILRQIFKNHGAVDIEERNATWTAEGWISLDPDADLPPQEDPATARRTLPRDEVEHHRLPSELSPV